MELWIIITLSGGCFLLGLLSGLWMQHDRTSELEERNALMSRMLRDRTTINLN